MLIFICDRHVHDRPRQAAPLPDRSWVTMAASRTVLGDDGGLRQARPRMTPTSGTSSRPVMGDDGGLRQARPRTTPTSGASSRPVLGDDGGFQNGPR